MITILIVITIVLSMAILLQFNENDKKTKQAEFERQRETIKAIMTRDPERIILHIDDLPSMDYAIEFIVANFETTAYMRYMQAITETEELYTERHGKRPY